MKTVDPGCVRCLSAGSFRRCLRGAWEEDWMLHQKTQEEWATRLCLLKRCNYYDVYFVASHFCWYGWYEVEGWKGVNLERGSVHHQGICMQRLWIRPPTHILGKLGGKGEAKQIHFAPLQEWRDYLRVYFPFAGVIEHP